MEPGEFAIKVKSVEGFIGRLVQGRFVLVFFSFCVAIFFA